MANASHNSRQDVKAPSTQTGDPGVDAAENAAGDALADQIQELLDEAVAATAASSTTPADAPAHQPPAESDSISAGDFQIETVEQQIEPAAVPQSYESAGPMAATLVAGDARAAVGESGDSAAYSTDNSDQVADPRITQTPKSQSISRLDESLAEQAEASITGDFETLDEVCNDVAAARVQASAPVAAALHDDRHDTAAPAASDGAMLEGEMESIEETFIEQPAAPAAPAVVAASVTVSVQQSAVLPAVPAAHPAPAAPEATPACESAPVPAASAKPGFKVSPLAVLVVVLTLVNRPFAGLAHSQRDLIGFISVQIASFSLSIIAGVRFGQKVGFITFAVLAVPLAWMLYAMVLRSPGPKPASASAS